MAGNWHKTDRMWRGGMMMVMSHKGYRRTERFHVNVSKRKLRASRRPKKESSMAMPSASRNSRTRPPPIKVLAEWTRTRWDEVNDTFERAARDVEWDKSPPINMGRGCEATEGMDTPNMSVRDVARAEK